MSHAIYVGKKVAIVVGMLFAVVSCGTCGYDNAPPEHAASDPDEHAVAVPSPTAPLSPPPPPPVSAPYISEDQEDSWSSEGAEDDVDEAYGYGTGTGQGFGSGYGRVQGDRRARRARRPASRPRAPGRTGALSGDDYGDDPLMGLDGPSAPAAGDGADDSVVIEEPGGILSLVDHVLSKLAVGNIAFNTPERMGINETETVELLLSTKETTKQLAAEVKGRPVETAEGVRVAPEMQADLKGQGFKIEAVTPSKQVVSNLQRTRWAWTVTALKDGKQNLDLSLSARVQVEGKDSPFVVKTFTKTIEVQVDLWGKIFALVKEHGQWLWTTILVPVAVWWRSRKKKAAS